MARAACELIVINAAKSRAGCVLPWQTHAMRERPATPAALKA